MYLDYSNINCIYEKRKCVKDLEILFLSEMKRYTLENTLKKYFFQYSVMHLVISIFHFHVVFP